MEEREESLDKRRWDMIAERARELADRLSGELDGSHAQMLDFEPAEYLSKTLTVGDLRLGALVLSVWAARHADDRLIEQRRGDVPADGMA